MTTQQYACASCGLPVDGPSQVIEDKLYHPRCATAFLRDRHWIEHPYRCPVCRGCNTVTHPTAAADFVVIPCPAKCVDGRLATEPTHIRATVGYRINGKNVLAGEDYKVRFDYIREGS